MCLSRSDRYMHKYIFLHNTLSSISVDRGFFFFFSLELELKEVVVVVLGFGLEETPKSLTDKSV